MASLEHIFLVLAALVVGANCDVKCYDHQTTDYKTHFSPVECGQPCTVTPFFSPDHSVDMYLSLIESATESIDIYTPGFDSWSYCTHYEVECDGQCIGCSLEDQRNESFPVFPALLNAMHQRHVAVRLLTNNYTQPTCQDKITPLDWLLLNGANIKFYKTTSFMHSKYVMVDKGKRTSVSSVNFSQTSFTKNREAGVVLDDCNCPTIAFYQSVFESDWELAVEYVIDNSYTKSEMEFITDPATMVYVPVPEPDIPGAYVTPLKTYSNVMVQNGYTSPDDALDTVMSQLKNVESSLEVAIYQITDTGLCNQINALHQNGMNVSLLVSGTIVSNTDWKAAQECYCKLYDQGLQGHIRKALTKFRFAHQKYWIIDNKVVHLSTGNWSPSDFPEGSDFPPHQQSVNRDLLVAMEGPDIVDAFQTVFEKDWASGTDWEPKYCD